MAGMNFLRELNVSELMHSAFEYHNALVPDGNENYFQFPTCTTGKKLNTEAKDALETITIDKRGENYGFLS